MPVQRTLFSPYPGSSRQRLVRAVPWLLLGLCLFMLLGWPLIMLIYGSLRTAPPGAAGSWSLHGFTEAYSQSQTYLALLRTVVYAVCTTILGLVMALLLLVHSVKSRLPLRRVITPAMLFTLALPPLFYGISFAMIGNPHAGLVNVLVHGSTKESLKLVSTTSWVGLVVVSSFKVTAWAYVLLLGPFRALNGTLEEAARISGAGNWRLLTRIVVPVLRPALVGVGVLVFVLGLGAFDVPLILGLPAGIRVFSTEIFNLIGESSPPNYAGGSALALLLVVVVILLVLLARRSLASRSFVTVDAKSHTPTRWKMGVAGIPLTAFTAAFLLIAVILPVAQLVIGSLQSYFGVYGKPTARNYVAVLDDPTLWDSIKTTILISVVAGGGAMLFATLVSYIQSRFATRRARVISTAAWLPLGLPGIVLGVGLLWGYTSIPGLRELYGTPWIMLIGLIVVGLPVGSRAIDGSIAQISEDLEAAARISGASRFGAVRRIIARLLAPSFLAGWFTVAVVLSGNLDVPILLSSTSSQPATLTAYNLYLDGNTAQAAALLCIVIGGGAAALILLTITGNLLSAAVRRVRNRQQVTQRDRAGHGDGGNQSHVLAATRMDAAHTMQEGV